MKNVVKILGTTLVAFAAFAGSPAQADGTCSGLFKSVAGPLGFHKAQMSYRIAYERRTGAGAFEKYVPVVQTVEGGIFLAGLHQPPVLTGHTVELPSGTGGAFLRVELQPDGTMRMNRSVYSIPTSTAGMGSMDPTCQRNVATFRDVDSSPLGDVRSVAEIVLTFTR